VQCLCGQRSEAKKNGETDERLFQVVAWRESDLFNRINTTIREPAGATWG
jgi:alkylhydroperoxidase family enzyme